MNTNPPQATIDVGLSSEDITEILAGLASGPEIIKALARRAEEYARQDIQYEFGLSPEEVEEYQRLSALFRFEARISFLRHESWKDVAEFQGRMAAARYAYDEFGPWEEVVIADSHPAKAWDRMPERDREEAKRLWYASKAKEGEE